jgi:hypothetical protein
MTERPLTNEESYNLPFDFINAVYIPPDVGETNGLYEAQWHGHSVYTTNLAEPWAYSAGYAIIPVSDWEKYYPNLSRLHVTAFTDPFEATYQGKSVRWSRSQASWVYQNNRPVVFDTLSEEQEVSAALESSIATLTRATETLESTRPIPGDFTTTLPRNSPTPERSHTPVPSRNKGKGRSRQSTLLASTSSAPAPPHTPEQPPTQSAPEPKPLTTPSRLPRPTHPVQPLVPPPAPPPAPGPPAPAMAAAAAHALPRPIGTSPESFDGANSKAQAFWRSVESYYYLNVDSFPDESRRVAAALTHFKLGSPAGNWAGERQATALALTPIHYGNWADFRTAFNEHFIPADAVLHSTQIMHSLKMGTRSFLEWYQEWHNHAIKSTANEATQMYAFRQNIPQALHAKILGVSPAPTTLEQLVRLAKGFDEAYRMWNKSAPSTSSKSTRTRAVAPDSDSTDPNVATLNSTSKKKFTKLTTDEKKRRRENGLCMYCGKKGHWANNCPEKKTFRPRPSPKTRALTTDEPKPDEPTPDPEPTVARLYTIPDHHFDYSHPDPDVDVHSDF